MYDAPMPTFSANDLTDLTPRMMVLGLVIQQADTIAGVGRRLADQFASARFHRSSAYKDLPPLARQGYVRLIEEGESPPLNVYDESSSESIRVIPIVSVRRLPALRRDGT